MTAHGADPELLGNLRLGERGAALPSSAGVADQGAGVDRGAGGNGTLSPDSLTYHIERDAHFWRHGDKSGGPDSRECDCPAWVDQCAHFDGRWIALHLSPIDDRTWVVCRGVEPIEYLEHGTPGHAYSDPSDKGLFTNLIDARDYFCSAEAALLRGSLPDAASAARCPAGPSDSFSLGPQNEAPAAEGSFPSAPALGRNVSDLTEAVKQAPR